ncbi:MAG: hypothetical protein WAV47_23395 [Blastocatellia bacterium]
MKLIERNQIKSSLNHICVLTVICFFVTQAFAQDPLKLLPHAYKLEFENDWVKVTRVHYAPHEKLPPHQHTQTASAYVYLNDGGPVVFNHIGHTNYPVTRRETKAGAFRLYRALQEIHEVQNLSDLPSDFLRVEIKTELVEDNTFGGRFYRVATPSGENLQKTQFDDKQVRITRLICASGKSLELTTSPTEPALLVALVPSDLKVYEGKGGFEKLKLEMGKTRWIAAGQQQKFQNTGSEPAELLRFDFKTKPLSKEALEKNKKDEHSKSE